MERRYKDGETIFKEGDAGLSAFVVVGGTVALFKGGAKGAVPLTSLGVGELFGEMGAIDKSPRSATAKAEGDVTLHVIPRNEFLEMLTTDSDMALRVMTKLVERLRATDEKLVAQQTAHAIRAEGNVPSSAKSKGGSLFGRFFGRKSPSKTPAKIRPALPLTVRVCPLSGDEKGTLSKGIAEALNGVGGIVTSTYSKSPFPAISENPEADLPGAIAKAAEWTVNLKADLLIWGHWDPDAQLMVLRFSPHPQMTSDRPGVFNPHWAVPIPLPTEVATRSDSLTAPPEAPCGVAFLRACVLSALDPRERKQAESVKAALSSILLSSPLLVDAEIKGLSGAERGAIGLARANIFAAWGNMDSGNIDSGNDGLDKSIDDYRRALRFLPAPPERISGEASRLLGFALQALAEKEGDADLLDHAARAYQEALAVLTKTTAPDVWGSLQNRLGQVYYRIDLEGGPGEPLKSALSAYQSALHVITKRDAPYRWAEVMNNLGQTLQLYGEQVGSEEVIRRAAESCRAALEIYTKDDTPLLWAASQNNLGSALFLLSKHVGSMEIVEDAIVCFNNALGFYEPYGAVRLAEITEKNLRRAESQLRIRKNQDETLPEWSDESPENKINSGTEKNVKKP